MTHAELIERGRDWLIFNRRCAVVIKERGCQGEIADVVGFTYDGICYLIECKAFISDFRADAGKPHRTDGSGMGHFRYYLTPPGMLAIHDVPDQWGLIEAHPTSVRFVKRIEIAGEPIRSSFKQTKKEQRLLIAELARYQRLYDQPLCEDPWTADAVADNKVGGTTRETT